MNIRLFGKGEYANQQDVKAWTKSIDCIFLRYAFNRMGCRFLLTNSRVPDINAGTIMESKDGTF